MNFGDFEDYFDFGCGAVDDKRLCTEAGTEHCSFLCPFSMYVLSRNPDDYPTPEDYEDNDNETSS